MSVERLLALVVLVCVAVAAGGAQQSPPAVDTSKLGPQVGAVVPPIAGTDQFGTAQTLASLAGPKGLMLVFSRSADWCPYCKTQLVELQGRYDDIKKQGLGLVAITYDSPETLKKFADSRGITFPLLSDPGSARIKRYGLFNDTVDPKTRAYGIPHPGTFILDAQRRRGGPLLRRCLSGALHRVDDSGDDGRITVRRRGIDDHEPALDDRDDQ